MFVYDPLQGRKIEKINVSDASSRRAAVSFALCYCFPFLEVPDVVHRAGLVCQLWQKYARSDALWEG